MVYKYHDDKTKMIIEPIGMYDEFQPAFNDLIRALRNLNYTYKEKYIYENGSYFFTLIDTHNGEKKIMNYPLKLFTKMKVFRRIISLK